MRGALGFVGVLVAVGVGMFVYRTQLSGPSSSNMTQGTNNIRAAADLTGVKNDLNSFAQAERSAMALNGKYLSLEELQSSGQITVDPRGRLGYTYSAEIGERGFTITATYSGPATGMPTLMIDETMQIREK